MWPFGGLVIVGLGLLPSAWHWLRHTPETLWQTVGSHVVTDALFSIGALIFLYVCVKYGECRCQTQPAPYPGAWIESDGHQQMPRGFAPGYLGLAFTITVIIPSAVLLYILVISTNSSSISRPLACATLLPYLLVFIPQILLETRFLNRSFMTPVLPVLYMYYRLWQFIRALGLAARYQADPVGGQAASLLKVYLVSLLVFWVFDTASTMLWMPWMYDWQLQDPQLLQNITNQRQQEQHTPQQLHHKQTAQKGDGSGADVPAASRSAVSACVTDSPAGPPATAGRRVRTRSMAHTAPPAAAVAAATPAKRAAGSAVGCVSPISRRRVVSTGSNVDSFGFGA